MKRDVLSRCHVVEWWVAANTQRRIPGHCFYNYCHLAIIALQTRVLPPLLQIASADEVGFTPRYKSTPVLSHQQHRCGLPMTTLWPFSTDKAVRVVYDPTRERPKQIPADCRCVVVDRVEN